MDRKNVGIIKLTILTLIGIIGIIACLVIEELDFAIISFGIGILIYFIHYIINQKKKDENKTSNSSKT